MKLDDVISKSRCGIWVGIEARRNPSDVSQWFLMVMDEKNKSFILLENDGAPILGSDLNALAKVVDKVGAREFKVFL